MSKQIQDAYIVAAVRTPVGKAPRGVFRNTRPDDLLAFAIDATLAQCPTVDKSKISDAIIGWLAASRGLIDPNGKPIGTDFSNVYAAGELTWQGKPADAYDPALQHAAEKATFGGREVPFYGWHYPPFFFAIAFFPFTDSKS